MFLIKKQLFDQKKVVDQKKKCVHMSCCLWRASEQQFVIQLFASEELNITFGTHSHCEEYQQAKGYVPPPAGLCWPTAGLCWHITGQMCFKRKVGKRTSEKNIKEEKLG